MIYGSVCSGIEAATTVETYNGSIFLTDAKNKSAEVNIYHLIANPNEEWLESVHDGIKSNNLYSLPRV
jgi:hypothetical protein